MNGKVNIYELAEITGFSSSTVSKALNNTGRISEKTRKIILDKIELCELQNEGILTFMVSICP